ncbi:MAG TPA: beta-ketoacyl synthase [Verrucomicrobia bacterium]|nr:MAG: beta-ketoacyl synthase [Lentisphaerae bacterium GWF2_57_35]HBA86373.1 beta-ketoacyl synthase [Verrucomicrobiota bacterium]
MEFRRVVITGMGAISPLGNEVGSMVDAVAAGQCATRIIEEWQKYPMLRSKVAAPVLGVDEKIIPRQDRRSMSKMSIYSALAAKQAIAAAGLSDAQVQSERTGCVISSTIGSTNTLASSIEKLLPDYDISKVTTMEFFQCISHTAALNVANHLTIRGMVYSPSAACASSMQSIGMGYDLIRWGEQDRVLCGGAEELHPMVTGSFDVLYAASKGFNDRPQQTPRPFDRDRDGLVCGEGAGILLLEELEHAQKRNAPIFGEVIGYHTCSTGDQISQSNSAAMIQCMTTALNKAGVKASEVDYVNAHATATPQGDCAEAEAIRTIFGSRTPVSSFKGHLGHTLGAAGALESIVCVEMARRNRLFPTHNLKNLDPDCAGIDHVVETREARTRTLLKNGFAFGGINATLLYRFNDRT